MRGVLGGSALRRRPPLTWCGGGRLSVRRGPISLPLQKRLLSFLDTVLEWVEAHGEEIVAVCGECLWGAYFTVGGAPRPEFSPLRHERL